MLLFLFIWGFWCLFLQLPHLILWIYVHCLFLIHKHLSHVWEFLWYRCISSSWWSWYFYSLYVRLRPSRHVCHQQLHFAEDVWLQLLGLSHIPLAVHSATLTLPEISYSCFVLMLVNSIYSEPCKDSKWTEETKDMPIAVTRILHSTLGTKLVLRLRTQGKAYTVSY